jgi:hypothetical protein
LAVTSQVAMVNSGLEKKKHIVPSEEACLLWQRGGEG